LSSLSVVIPNYNKDRFIAQTLEAICTQSRPPDEVLVIDDASTDKSVEIIQTFVEKYDFLKLIRNEANQGVNKTINKGVSLAKSIYVYSAGSDDYVEPGFFEKAMAVAEKSVPGVIFGYFNVVSESGLNLGPNKELPWNTDKFGDGKFFMGDYLLRMPIGHSFSASTIFKRSDFYELKGFNKELGPWGDTFLIYCCALKSGFYYINNACANWRVTGNQYSSDISLNEFFLLFTKAAKLMRSEEYCGLFPISFVEQWEARIEDSVVERFVLGHYKFGIKSRLTGKSLFMRFCIAINGIYNRIAYYLFGARYRHRLKVQIKNQTNNPEAKSN
jgi:glycosyltransferase involved in cell wall biosynthesis